MISADKGIITLKNAKAECKISLWGGNVLSYRPLSQKEDVFWVGDKNKFDGIQAIRGGIPVCWPRFAEEKLNDCFPRHGFARLSEWKLKNLEVNEDFMSVKLSLIPDAKYNIDVAANLYVNVNDKLECVLETLNLGDKEFVFSEALHAYFNVSNRDKIKIKGLDGYQYKSSIDGKIYSLKDDLKIEGEFDGAFINHLQKVEIDDPDFNRVIVIEKSGSKSTVVWNPDKDLAEMSQGQYKNFVCVEPANQGDMFVVLPPKETHKISMTVSVL